jgi:hypothetical protein
VGRKPIIIRRILMAKHYKYPHTRKVLSWKGYGNNVPLVYDVGLLEEPDTFSISPKEITLPDYETPLVYIDYPERVKYHDRTVWIFGFQAKSLLGKRFEELSQNPEEREKIKSGLERALSLKEGKSFEGDIKFASVN